MNDFTILQHPVDFAGEASSQQRSCPIPPSSIAFPAQGVPRILRFQKLKIHPHLGCGICMQVFGGNRKDYLESVNLLELIETPCSFIPSAWLGELWLHLPFIEIGIFLLTNLLNWNLVGEDPSVISRKLLGEWYRFLKKYNCWPKNST